MTDQSLHLFTPSEVAEELALRDAEMLRQITPGEIRDGAWMHEEKASTTAIPESYVCICTCYVNVTTSRR